LAAILDDLTGGRGGVGVGEELKVKQVGEKEERE